MFESLKDADELLFTCVEEGLVYGTNVNTYRSALDALRMRAEDARFEAHAARTYAEDFANWVKGLSRQIADICWQVRDVRADISSNSLRERERQANLRQRAAAETEDCQRGSESNTDTASSFVSSASSSLSGEIASAEHSAEGCGEVHPYAPTPPSASGRRDETVTASSYLVATPSGSAAELDNTSHLSMVTPLTAQQSKKTGHSNRRHSVSSESSGGSSLQNMRRKKRGGDPLARARTMARFARQARATRTSPVLLVEPNSLASFELVDSDDDGDDEWVDEQAVRIVA